MKVKKLILINLTVIAVLFGSAITSLLVFDLFFGRNNSKSFKKDYEYTKLSQIFKESKFPKEISLTYYPDYGFNFFGLDKIIFPIVGRSNIRTFYCEEQGFLTEYMSDRHGFRNPNSVLDNKKLDIALVGDSFVDGACTNKFTFRKNLTELSNKNLSIANFALGGTGPLLQLAYMKEFGKHYEPSRVFWFWAINDLRNLQDELQSPLRKYMIKDFSQDLFNTKNKKISDNIVEEYYEWVKKQKNKKTSSTLYEKKVAVSMRFPKTYKVYKTIKRVIPQFYFDTPAYWDKTTILSREKVFTRRINCRA